MNRGTFLAIFCSEKNSLMPQNRQPISAVSGPKFSSRDLHQKKLLLSSSESVASRKRSYRRDSTDSYLISIHSSTTFLADMYSFLDPPEYQLILMKISWWDRNVKIWYKCLVVSDEFLTATSFQYLSISDLLFPPPISHCSTIDVLAKYFSTIMHKPITRICCTHTPTN